MMDGILIIDKPEGFTSHDVVARARRILKEKRVGHTGTLDPFATGVLVVLVGRATRLAQFLNSAEKEYEGVIRFGYAMDTGDATGVMCPDSKAIVTSSVFAESWDAARIDKALSAFRGTIEQIPPMYSAKKVKGRRLYELARRGEEVEREPVQVTIREFEATQKDGELVVHNSDGTCDLSVRVVCSAGTYIRTLAESVGQQLGIAAHLRRLRRTRAGGFYIESAKTLTELEQFASSGGDVGSCLIPLRAALSGMTSTSLDDNTVRRVSHGATVPISEPLRDGELVQMCDYEGRLIAIGTYEEQLKSLRPRVVFVTGE